MLEMKKDRQFWVVTKTTKANTEGQIVGKFNVENCMWEIPFNASACKGQKYPNLLRAMRNYNFSEYYYEDMKPVVNFVDRISSIFNVDINSLAQYFCNREIQIKLRHLSDKQTKTMYKYFSKNKESINVFNITADTIFIASADLTNELYKREFVEEIYGYYVQIIQSQYYKQSNLNILSFEEFYALYIGNINDKIREGYTNNEIMTVLRIYYFQGAGVTFNIGMIYNYINCCKLLEKPIPTGNFLMNYRAITNEYYEAREKLAMKNFSNAQNLKNWNFEFENYSIFIPQSRNDLKKYGDIFHNCLNGWEWTNRLSKGTHCAVIVLKDNKPHICCDICLANFEICQYYYEGNGWIYDNKDLEFKAKYQEYLFSLK